MSIEAIAKHRYARLSPKKTAIVMDLVRGKLLEKAKVILSFDKTKPAKMVLKVVKSAEANAQVKNMDISSLYVSEIYVCPGPITKRGKAGSKGRTDPIKKRTGHVFVKLSFLVTPGDKNKIKKEEKIETKRPAKKEAKK